MQTAAEVGILVAVESGGVRIIVELDAGEPVCGSAGREGGPSIPFEGMLGLISLFEQLRATDDRVSRPRLVNDQ